MLVSEIILRKTNIEYKIDELKKYLLWLRNNNVSDKKNKYEKTLSTLFNLLDTLCSYNALLSRHNEETTVLLGEKKLSISEVLNILEGIEQKIDIITSIINNNDTDLNIFELITDRDKLIDEQILLLKVIRTSDWSTYVK